VSHAQTAPLDARQIQIQFVCIQERVPQRTTTRATGIADQDITQLTIPVNDALQGNFLQVARPRAQTVLLALSPWQMPPMAARFAMLENIWHLEVRRLHQLAYCVKEANTRILLAAVSARIALRTNTQT
jgi:hypothetical protein